MADKTGWEAERRVHFDEIVENYDKARWDYPDALFADIFAYAGADAGKKALEIGAGTGKATAPFLEAGYGVTAVEMGANMSAFLREKFKAYPQLDVVTDAFEHVSLENALYDIVYAASSFHWIDAAIGCPKVHGLLKDGGVFALFRNNADPVYDDLYTEVQAVYDEHYYSHYNVDKRPVAAAKMTTGDFAKPAELYRGFRLDGLAQYGFEDIQMKLYTISKAYAADAYIALLDTYSDHRALPEENKAELYAGIHDAIVRHGGYQRMNCVFQLYMGRKSARK